MAEIEQGVYRELDCAKEVFRIAQRFTEIARDVDQKHTDALRELAHQLLAVGQDVSDNAMKIGINFANLSSKK